MAHTGPYPKGTIDQVPDTQMGRMKMFRGSKPASSQWLGKQKAVKQSIDAFYQKDTPREKP